RNGRSSCIPSSCSRGGGPPSWLGPRPAPPAPRAGAPGAGPPPGGGGGGAGVVKRAPPPPGRGPGWAQTAQTEALKRGNHPRPRRITPCTAGSPGSRTTSSRPCWTDLLGPDAQTELALMSHVDFMREASARTPGGAVEEGDGTFLYAGPHPLPMFVNGAVRTEPAVRAHRVVDRAQAFFRGRNRGFSVYALVGRDEDLIEAADRGGLTAFNDPAPLMVLNGSVPPSDLPADVRIEGVTTPKHVSDAAAVCADAYAVYGMQADVAPACLTTRTMLVPNMAAVVAYDPEGPVATASALVTRGVSYISWVGTAQRAM